MGESVVAGIKNKTPPPWRVLFFTLVHTCWPRSASAVLVPRPLRDRRRIKFVAAVYDRRRKTPGLAPGFFIYCAEGTAGRAGFEPCRDVPQPFPPFFPLSPRRQRVSRRAGRVRAVAPGCLFPFPCHLTPATCHPFCCPSDTRHLAPARSPPRTPACSLWNCGVIINA